MPIKKPQPTYKLYLQYSGIGFQMMGAIAICAWLGNLLDQKLNTEKPFITIIAMLLGVGASIYLMIRSIKQLNERLEKQKEQE